MSGADLFTPPDVERIRRPDGVQLLRSRSSVPPYPRSVAAWLCDRADDRPDGVFLAERPGGDASRPWITSTYSETWDAARRLGQALLDRDLGQDRPLAILSGPSIAHAHLMLAGHLVGVPIVPISVAYSVIANDPTKVEHILAQTRPGMVYADIGGPFERVLRRTTDVARSKRSVVTGDGSVGTPLAELRRTAATGDVDAAFDSLEPDGIAKILYTSGSTGLPKGVVTTHRMLCVNQASMRAVWPFLAESAPIICDWLPWSHTFGGSHNFNMVLANGGSLFIDAGKPAPGLFDTTVTNLVDVRPTISFNVPAGYARLVDRLEADDEAAEAFFDRLQLIFYAAAALPQDVWRRLETLSERVTGATVPMTSSWGLTETAPAVTAAHFPISEAGVIGTPIPGVTLKLVPSGDKTEIRVSGESVTPGYFRDPDTSAAAFDPEGFFITGDAVTMADPDDPDAGLVFDGRVAEDFKLTTGTWVSVGTLRPAVLAATSPLLLDGVVTGHGREWLGMLVWLHPDAADSPDLRAELARRVADHNTANGNSSSTRIRRILVMQEPPSIDRGETTDKGYINQRATLAARAELVEAIYSDDERPDVIVVG